MESPTGARLGFSEIHVGTTCHVQSAENRFGPLVLEDLKTFVYEEGPHVNFPTEFDEDDEDDDGENEGDESFTDEDDTNDVLDDVWIAAGWEAANIFPSVEDATVTQVEHPDASQDAAGGGLPQHSFPRMARLRCNLTAMSQRYNLYFAAYQDKIYVYQPRRAPQILPPPSLILSPKKTKVAKILGGTIVQHFGHQMNSIMVGNLGILEVVFFAFDDGDVGAYYTHAIAGYIKANSEYHHGFSGHPPRQQLPKEFFHDNVGKSAWGLAIHERSRLLAVSSNKHEVTVFAFAMNENMTRVSAVEEDTSPKVCSGQTALQLEKHFRSRTRTWRIVLPAGPEGRNMPSIAFCDDDEGHADKVVAFDIDGNTWIFDIWKIGSFPIIYPPTPSRCVANHRFVGWGVLVLPDSSFKQANTLSECLGLPANEIIRCLNPSRTVPSSPDPEVWLDTTCSLFHVQDLAPDPEVVLRQRHAGGPYLKIHCDSSHQLMMDVGPDVEAMVPQVNDENWSDAMYSDSDSDDGVANGPDETTPTKTDQHRWTALAMPPGPKGSVIDDLAKEVHLGRAIVPSLGQTPPLDGTTNGFLRFSDESVTRIHNTKPVKFLQAEFPSHMAKNLTMLRTTCTDIELQPFDPHGTGILCKSVLTHHNHHGRRNEPWDLARPISERVSMLIHVPELNLVVAGALHGRVALLTLTKIAKRVHNVPVQRGFRVDWVLPRRHEEDKRLRPLCALHGIAISPTPVPKAQGLDLQGRQARLPPVWYRLILHYVDHTILMYDIARQAGEEDLMIF